MTTSDHSSFNDKLQFNGVFTDALRQALHEKRMMFGFSLQQLGDFLKIHWSTIRKWEAGITITCHPRHIARIGKFLSGGFDEQLRMISGQEPFLRVMARKIPTAANQCMERATQTYQLCHSDFPDLGADLLNAIDQAIQSTVREFLNRLEQSASAKNPPPSEQHP